MFNGSRQVTARVDRITRPSCRSDAPTSNFGLGGFPAHEWKQEIILARTAFHSIQKCSEIDQLRARIQKNKIECFVASHGLRRSAIRLPAFMSRSHSSGVKSYEIGLATPRVPLSTPFAFSIG